MRALFAMILLGLLAAGCVPPALDLGNRRCPCATGWSCDVATDRCVPGALADAAAGLDAGRDTGLPPTDADVDAFTPPIDTGIDALTPPVDTGIDAFTPPVDAGHDAFTPPVDTGADAGHDAGMPGDTGCGAELAAALVCDGFESEPGPWTARSERSGTVVSDSLQALRGTRAMHPRTTAGGGEASRRVDALGPFTSGELWVRISTFLPAGAAEDNFTWFSIGETSPPYAGLSLGMGASVIGSYSTISGDWVSNDTLTVPYDTWTCLELHVAISDTAGSIEVYENGTLGASTTGIDTLPATGFTSFSIGIDYTDAAQPPLELWLDEVALSRTRLPCP